MKKEKRWTALAVLNILMTADNWLSTSQLQSMVDCQRKSVYAAVDQLEVNGFHVVIEQHNNKNGAKENYYKFGGHLWNLNK